MQADGDLICDHLCNSAGHVDGGAGRAAIDEGIDEVFERGIERDADEFAHAGFVGAAELLTDCAAEGIADVFGQHFEVFGFGPPLAEGFEYGFEIADGHALAQQVLENLLKFDGLDDRRNGFFDDLGTLLFELLEQVVDFVAREQFVGVLTHDLGEVCAQHAGCVNDGVVEHLGTCAGLLIDPPCVEAERRFFGTLAFDLAACETGVHREQFAWSDESGSNGVTADFDAVLGAGQLHVVANADGRHDETEFDGELSTYAGNAVEQIATLTCIDKRDEGVADFEFHRVDFEQALDGRWLGFDAGGRLGGCIFFGCYLLFFTSTHRPRHQAQRAAYQHEWNGGQGREREQTKEASGNDEAFGLARDLVGEFVAQLLLAAAACDDEGTGDRYDEAGDLRGEAVTDGELGEDFGGFACVPAANEDADREAADDVDDGDDEAGDGIASHEFACTVHGTVEVGFLSEFFATAAGFGFVDVAGVEIAVDGHLLAGHGVQGEACCDFTDACGTFGDDQELHDDHDEENDDADEERVACDKVAEGHDDMTSDGGGFFGGLCISSENEARAGDVEDETEERGCEQQRWKYAEFHRVFHVDGGEQHHDADGDVEADEHVHDH